jgi:hypothetical protein
MTVRVTLDVFSGRPNPTIELGKDTATRFLDSVAKAKTAPSHAEDPRPLLGYRGMIIEHALEHRVKLPARFRLFRNSLIAGNAVFGVTDTATELLLLRQFHALLPDLSSTDLLSSIDSVRSKMPPVPPPTSKLSTPSAVHACVCAPLYEPQWWNDGAEGGRIQFHNNCYNYACDYRSDTFAQPGRAAGAMYAHLECAFVAPAALKDSLESYPRRQIQCPEEGHLVALVMWPQYDFHWYRLGRDGSWTHKPGGMPVTNVDNSGNVIRDPRVADRGDYTKFCAFMVVRHGHVKIQ